MENRLLTRFPGVIGFPVTPFNAQDELDEAAFRTNVQFMLDTELAALAFCGSNGEMPSITLPEYERVAAIAGEMVGDSKGLILGVGQTLKTAQHMARTARKAGAEAILLVAPYMNDRNLKGLADYYRRVAGAAEIPVFLYQTKWSGVLELALLDMLTDVENILMVKDEHGDLSHFLNVRSQFGDRYTWINGMAEPFVPAYWNLGIQTFTSGLACFMPKTTIDILHMAQAGDFPGITRVLRRHRAAVRHPQSPGRLQVLDDQDRHGAVRAARRLRALAADRDEPRGPRRSRRSDGDAPASSPRLSSHEPCPPRGRAGAGRPMMGAAGCSPVAQGETQRIGPADERGRYPLRIGKLVKRRQIAPLMNVAHADWLTRPERDAEEQPDRVVAALQIPVGGTVVDLGAGVGYFTWRLARAVGPQGRVIAVDIQPGMIELLEKNLVERGITNVQTVLGSEADPRLPPSSADLVLLVDVYHELQEPELTMAAVRKALKPNGRVVMIEYRKEDPSIPIDPLHKMTLGELRREIEPIGFRFDELLDFLPKQHIVVFRRDGAP